jgi:hypothetical protein
MQDRPPIVFLYPSHNRDDVPGSVEEFDRADYRGGVRTWVLQTYLQMKEAGMRCEIAQVPPAAGLVIGHIDSMAGMAWSSSRYLVCIKPDRPPLRIADLHVMQNRHDHTVRGLSQGRWPRTAVPFWPQAGLIPRDPSRRHQFTRIGYFGKSDNLERELQTESWLQSLANEGLEFVALDDWRDYSSVDVVLAVRFFSPQDSHNHKPPSKLINGWMAGVPVLVGPEAIYDEIRESALDFITVHSCEETLVALKRLREDAQLRQAMVVNGWERCKRFTASCVCERWIEVFGETVFPLYEEWRSRSRACRQVRFASRTLDYMWWRLRASVRRRKAGDLLF